MGTQATARKTAPARVPSPRSAPAEGIVAAAAREPQGQAPPAGPRRCRRRQAGRRQPPARQRPAQPVSPHLVDPAQTVLFDARRDWSCLTAGDTGPAARLTPAAGAIVEELDRQARLRGWTKASRNNANQDPADTAGLDRSQRPHPRGRHQGAQQPPRHHHPASPAVPRRPRHGHPRPRPAGHRRRAHHPAAHPALSPTASRGEVLQWVKVVRGEGRRAHRELPFATIRSYLNCLYPVLADWSQHITSLREITRDDVQAALDERPGVTARNLLPALRSLFRALKQERIIFRDPTRGITLPAMRRLPVPIPTDLLRGLIDRAGTPIAKVTVALIAIHGLGKKETTLLLLDDLDLSRGHLARPPPDRNAHRLPRRALPHAHDRLAPRTTPPLAAHRQPPPAGHPADRRRRPRPADRPHRHGRHLRRARPQPRPNSGRTGSWTRPGTPPTPSTSCASSASPPSPP